MHAKAKQQGGLHQTEGSDNNSGSSSDGAGVQLAQLWPTAMSCTGLPRQAAPIKPQSCYNKHNEGYRHNSNQLEFQHCLPPRTEMLPVAQPTCPLAIQYPGMKLQPV